MQFINILMLFGLLAVSIPIIIQLLTRKNVRRIAWGARSKKVTDKAPVMCL